MVNMTWVDERGNVIPAFCAHGTYDGHPCGRPAASAWYPREGERVFVCAEHNPYRITPQPAPPAQPDAAALRTVLLAFWRWENDGLDLAYGTQAVDEFLAARGSAE